MSDNRLKANNEYMSHSIDLVEWLKETQRMCQLEVEMRVLVIHPHLDFKLVIHHIYRPPNPIYIYIYIYTCVCVCFGCGQPYIYNPIYNPVYNPICVCVGCGQPYSYFSYVLCTPASRLQARWGLRERSLHKACSY